jgi:hypothetical protein
MGSFGHDPVQLVLYSFRPRSTHAVGAGAAGQPVVGSQHSTLPAADLVLFNTGVGVAKTQFPDWQPHGEAIQPCQLWGSRESTRLETNQSFL